MKKILELIDDITWGMRLMYVFCVCFTSYAIMSDEFPNVAKLIMFVCTVMLVILTEFVEEE